MIPSKKSKMSPTEYLEIEREATYKSEFFDGEMFAMAGGSFRHNIIKDNLFLELGNRLKGSPFRPISSDQRILVSAAGLYTYPDIVVLCGQPIFDARDKDTLTNPTAIIEVLSPTTERYDRGDKFRNYQKIDSLKEYVMVYQDEPLCERFVRQEDGSWALVSFVGLSASLVFTSVSASIPLADVYAGVTFPDGQLQ